MKTVHELIIAICDDLREYLNDTPITEMQIDVTARLLELLRYFKVIYVDTDSVGCVPGYPEVRPDIYAPDPDDAEDKDAADEPEVEDCSWWKSILEDWSWWKSILEDWSWRKFTLDDFNLGEIEKTMEQPIDYNSRKPFRPELMGIYRLAGTESKYQCIALNDGYYEYTMRNIKSGWTCDVRDIGIYNNYSIDWPYSTNGHFS